MTAWSYDGLNQKATFVVIATPTKVTTTTEHAALPNIRAGTNEIIGTGLETSFEVLTVLKGPPQRQDVCLAPLCARWLERDYVEWSKIGFI